MLRKLLDNKLKLLLTLALVFVLVCVRAFEDVLFYDPFYVYFKNDYLNQAFPKFDAMQLFFAMTFRYFINSMVSLGIIYALFSDFQLTKFAGVLYAIFYVVLMLALFSLLEFSDNGNNFLLFYIRRFLIQPLFLVLFVPAFYYQERMSKK